MSPNLNVTKNLHNSGTFRLLRNLRPFFFSAFWKSGPPALNLNPFLKIIVIDQLEHGEYLNRPIASKVNRTTETHKTDAARCELGITSDQSGLERIRTFTDRNPKTDQSEAERIRTDQSAAAAAPTTLHIPVHVFASTNVKSCVTLNYFCNVF